VTPPPLDCLIVGAGPVGCLLALALGQHGVRTALVEPQAAGGRGGDLRGLALSAASLRVLERLGIPARLAGAMCPVESILVSDQGGPGVLLLRAADAGLAELGRVVPAGRLQDALEMAVAELPDGRCRLLRGTRVLSLACEPGAMQVELASPQGSWKESARLVVLADGGRSPLRERLGFRVEAGQYQQALVVCTLRPQRHPGRRALEVLTRTGPLAVLPAPEGLVTVVRCVPVAGLGDALSMSDVEWCAHLESLLGRRLGRLSEPGPRQGYPLGHSLAVPAWKPRLLLLGAALRTFHPNGAQGLNLAVRDIAVLTERLLDTLAGGGDPGVSAVLEGFTRARLHDQRHTAQLADALWWTASRDFPGAHLGRGAVMAALNLCPSLRRRVVLRAAGLAGTLPRLLRGAPLAALDIEEGVHAA
jgi:2-octaprenyl-6-methoxyphenol hydroxylase